MAIPGWLADDPRIRHHHHRPAQPGTTANFPDWVSPAIKAALARLGVESLWRHQAEAAELAFAGTHVSIATPTASGKSIGYLLPVLAATQQGMLGFEVPPAPLDIGRGHSALYLAPTKALAHDQLRMCQSLAVTGWPVGALDGDSDAAERRYARDFARFVFTNPDMLHRSVLPRHQHWARLFSTLRYVVIDEAHRYRGVFGAHVAAVLRRLRRVANHYRCEPVFVAASATLNGAADLLARLAGVEGVAEVNQDTSARPGLDYLVMASDQDPYAQTADLLARLVSDGRQTLAFTTSRVQAELIAVRAQSKALPARIAAYRGGYLASDRRQLEAELQAGELRGVACTNALELGVDISGLDAVISCGFPGTVAALRQQAGRAGRSGQDALGILVTRPDPLEAYLCDHPELLFERPVERIVLHPENPYVLAPHVAAAAQELPVTLADNRYFGESLAQMLAGLTAAGHLRHRASGWYWTRPDRAADGIDLRSAGGGSVTIVEEGTGRVIGQVDAAAADRTVHQGAVYLHQGDQWLVLNYDPGAQTAVVRLAQTGYFTQPTAENTIRILERLDSRVLGIGRISFGTVELAGRVTGFMRRDELTGKVWDTNPLDLPDRVWQTSAVWYTLPGTALAAIPGGKQAGAAHAAEHCAIGLLPAFAPCDRWDIGGLSTINHPDTEELTVFVHDGQSGGAGFAERGYLVAEDWLSATLERLRRCDCIDGCPACVVSPKCGNGNSPLDKEAAATLVSLLLPRQ